MIGRTSLLFVLPMIAPSRGLIAGYHRLSYLLFFICISTMWLVFARDPAGPYGWLDLPYAPRELHRAIALLRCYRQRFPDRTYVLGRDDCFGRPTLDVDSELRITDRMCEPISHDDVFEMVG